MREEAIQDTVAMPDHLVLSFLALSQQAEGRPLNKSDMSSGSVLFCFTSSTPAFLIASQMREDREELEMGMVTSLRQPVVIQLYFPLN
jgi:hypothetical protein